MNNLESRTEVGLGDQAERSLAAPALGRWILSASLRTKLVIGFLVVALVPLALLAFLNTRAAEGTLAASVGANMKVLADSQALVIGDLLDQQVNRLQLLSQNQALRGAVQAANATYTQDPATIQAEIDRLDKQWRAADAADNDADPLVQSRLNNEWADILRGYRDILPDNVEVFITDKFGAVVATTNRTSDYNQADEEWWQTAWKNGQGAIYIGQLEYDESSKTYASNIAVPVYAADKKTVIGVLRTTLQLTTLMDTLQLARLGQTGRAELYLPGDLRLVEKGDKPEPADKNIVVQLKASQTSTYIETNYEGVPRLISQAQVTSSGPGRADAIAQLGWTVVVHQSRAESLTGTRALAQTAMLLSLIIAAAVAGAAVVGAQLLTTPIRQLTVAAQQVAAGDLTVQARQETRDEIGTLAGAFNTMIGQLRQTLAGLEQRVAERTRDLERRSVQLQAAGEVGRAATSILETDQLIGQVVELIRARFDLYYVGLFLVDEAREWAVLRAGTGQAGQAMLARGHRIRIGEGMIGWSITNAQARIALEAGVDAVRLATAELPETRSEAALPLRTRGQVIGALTVQSAQPGAFDQIALAALQVMADQVAVALDNAHLFAESQAALEAMHRMYGEQSRQAWQQMVRTHSLRYLCTSQSIYPTGGQWGPEMVRARKTGQPAQDGSSLAVPIKVRDQILGAVRLRKSDPTAEWTVEETALLQTLTEQLGVALESARLYQDTQRRAVQEQLVGEVTSRMRETLDVETVLRTAANEMRQALGLEGVIVQLAGPETIRDAE